MTTIPIVDVSCLSELCKDPRFYRVNASHRYNKKDLTSVRNAVIEHLYEQKNSSDVTNNGSNLDLKADSNNNDVAVYKAINAYVDNASYALKPDVARTSQQLYKALHEVGFTYISHHAASIELQQRIDTLSRDFFKNRPISEKMGMSMPKGGKAWRGYFPVGGELTSGKPDIKEGIYFGQKIHMNDDEAAGIKKDDRADQPLFGDSLYPTDPSTTSAAATATSAIATTTRRAWPAAVEPYMQQCESLGQAMMILLAVALELPSPLAFIAMGVCGDPLGLFRIFHYPPPATLSDPKLRDEATLWGVGEHTDYGLLTLLKQDDVGGLQVRHRNGSWVPAPPIDGTLVVNVGDMLEAITKGLLLSTPHRVKNPDPSKMRISFPYFFDPCVDFVIRPLKLSDKMEKEAQKSVEARRSMGWSRWDNQLSVDVGSMIQGEEGLEYGTYLLRKVTKVFPMLAKSHL